jgi:hypothetical protein
MATMGRYCKAYYVRRLSEFPAWHPNLEHLRPEVTDVDGEEVQTRRTELQEDNILYLQENYAITDGIFLDENVVFDPGTPEWKEFCRGALGFEIPVDQMPPPPSDASVAAPTQT